MGGEAGVAIGAMRAGGEAGWPDEVGGAGASGGAGGPPGGNITLPALPAPCGSIPYSIGLQFYGGSAPYTWQLTPAVEGWKLEVDPEGPDSSHALLTSEHPGAPAISIAVTDASGTIVTKTYSVTPRTACWFAFTALTATGGPKLTLVDPVLNATPPVAFTHNQDVYDFAFSPDGKYLSYRFGADGSHEKGQSLAVVNLSTWTEQELILSDDADSANDVVSAFAWSSDSSTLAVAFMHGGMQYLGGTRFTPDGQPSKLTPKQTAVDSELYWIGSNHVAFYANGTFDLSNPTQLVPTDGYVTAFYSTLGAVGFEPATLSTDMFYELPVFVQTASDGFYMNSPSWYSMQFNWIRPGGPTGVDHTRDYKGRIISPSGRVTADLPSGQLNLYRAESPDQILTNATAPNRDCPFFLAWAKGKERMACVRDVPANAQGKKYSELLIFDLDDNNVLTTGNVPGYCLKDAQSPSATDSCADREYDYPSAGANLTPRVFSRTGDWLAFAPSSAGPRSYLYVADLRSRPFRLGFKVISRGLNSDPTAPSKLDFSPDGEFLLQEIGGALTAYSVSGSGMLAFLPDFDANAPDSNPQCSEDFPSAPDRWCGSADRNAPFKWSPSSKFAAYRSGTSTAVEALSVVDFTGFPSVTRLAFFAPSCGTKCSGQFAFQP